MPRVRQALQPKSPVKPPIKLALIPLINNHEWQGFPQVRRHFLAAYPSGAFGFFLNVLNPSFDSGQKLALAKADSEKPGRIIEKRQHRQPCGGGILAPCTKVKFSWQPISQTDSMAHLFAILSGSAEWQKTVTFSLSSSE